jgi:hypothetical protein
MHTRVVLKRWLNQPQLQIDLMNLLQDSSISRPTLPVQLGYPWLWEKLRPNAVAIRMQPTAAECSVPRTKA